MMNSIYIFLLTSIIFLNITVNASAQQRDVRPVPSMHLEVDSISHQGSGSMPDIITFSDSTEINYWKNVVDNRKSKVGKLISKLLINTSGGKQSAHSKEDAIARFEPFRGKRVSQIDVRVLPPYGFSVYDTVEPDLRSLKWLYRMADRTHIKTSEKFITKQLTTKLGYKVDPFVLIQEEINLKRLEIINDALIVLEEDPYNPDWVVMTVICKDKFTWSGIIGTNFRDQFGLNIENINLFGMGQSANYGFEFDGDKWKKIGHTVKLQYPNIAGIHMNANFLYKNNYKDKIISGELEIPFITNIKKWAGGIGYDRVYYSHELPDKNVSWMKDKFNYSSYDMWVGHLFNLKDKNRYDRNLYLTGRTYSTLFKGHGENSGDDIYHFYCDRYNSLVSLQFIKVKYYKVHQLFDLGRSEFIPHGMDVGTVLGYEKNSMKSSNYIEGWTTLSLFDENSERYYGASISIGSHINNKGFNRGFLKTEARFISQPFSLGTSHTWRIYNDINYTTGFKRYPEEYLFLEESELRGFKSDSLFGNRKLGVSLSWMAFSPQLRYDFRLAFGTFVDLAVIAPKDKSIFQSRSYFGIGAQLNIQNNFLFIKNIAIRFAFYPKIPKAANRYDVQIDSWSSNKLYNFNGGKPKMSIFK